MLRNRINLISFKHPSNMKLFLLVVFATVNISFAAQKILLSDILDLQPSYCFPDYYWRDFRGKIPSDAVKGGRTPSGRPFYVAQVYVPSFEFTPGMIVHNKSEALTIATGARVIRTSSNVKVLCSKHKNNLKWVSINSEDLHKLDDVHVVIGGTEIGEAMYIGKAFDDFSAVIGKIYKHGHGYRGLWIPTKTTQINHLSYGVLVYVCDGEKLKSRNKKKL